MRLPKWASAYLFLQADAVVVWWVLLYTNAGFRARFFPIEHERLLFALVAPDLLIYFICGSLAAVFVNRNSVMGRMAIAILTGGAAYATLFSLTLPLVTGVGWLGAACMAPSLLVTGYLCYCSFAPVRE